MFKCSVWTFTALHGVDLHGSEELDLGGGFSLAKPTPLLLSVRDRDMLSGRQYREVESASCFLVYRADGLPLPGLGRDICKEALQDGLMGLQITKPVRTLGIIFRASTPVQGSFGGPFHFELRPPMEPPSWAEARHLDQELLQEVPANIEKLVRWMKGTDVRIKNAVNFLQLGLEHFHPLISGVFFICGIDALVESRGRDEFRARLVGELGGGSLVFPDWNSPLMTPPSSTVDEVSADMYTLRSKVLHGVDLREAQRDKKYPVDLLRAVRSADGLDSWPYAVFLCEAALHLLIRLLQRRD